MGPGLTSPRKLLLRLRQHLSITIPVLLIILCLAYLSLPLLGRWLVREDAVQPADAIAVLAGRFPQRALEAARLYHEGFAREVWLTRPRKHTSFDELGEVQFLGEDDRNFEVLRSFGVPEYAIRILDVPIINTADELNAISSGLKTLGDSSVIIVTSKAHTRRVFSLWDKYHAGDGEALIHGVSYDPFSPSHWWKSAGSRDQAIHEFLGMLDMWAGLPVHRPLPQVAPTPSDASAAPTTPEPPGD